MKPFLGLAAVWLTFFLNTAPAIAADVLPSTTDWTLEAASAREEGIPIMVVFSADHCNSCERLLEEVLLPSLKKGKLAGRVHLIEFNIDAGGKVKDFDGDRIRSRIFISRYEIFATPTVVLLDYQGTLLVAPIVGFNSADKYSDQLDRSVNEAYLSLAVTRTPHFAIR